jgi:hypothetical protein
VIEYSWEVIEVAKRVVKLEESVARQRLADVPPEKQFWCCDGRVMRNLSELAAALKEINDETFAQHSNESKSDFSNWVREVIGDEKLAKDLKKSKSRSGAVKVVDSRIAWLNKRAGL